MTLLVLSLILYAILFKISIVTKPMLKKLLIEKVNSAMNSRNKINWIIKIVNFWEKVIRIHALFD